MTTYLPVEIENDVIIDGYVEDADGGVWPTHKVIATHYYYSPGLYYGERLPRQEMTEEAFEWIRARGYHIPPEKRLASEIDVSPENIITFPAGSGLV